MWDYLLCCAMALGYIFAAWIGYDDWRSSRRHHAKAMDDLQCAISELEKACE